MKSVNIVITVALWAVVIGLGYYLYKTIEEPVTFETNLVERSEATQNRLLDIKVAQEYYKQQHRTYASNFDDLINTVLNEKLRIIKTIGDPDDTSAVVTYDTIYVPILDDIVEKKKFKGTTDPRELRYIPNTNNLQFDLAMDTIRVQRVELSVFEAKATKDKYLFGLDEDRIANPIINDLSIGSLESASGKGSWE